MNGRRNRRSPAEERRRWFVVQALCLTVLALITAYFVFRALTMP